MSTTLYVLAPVRTPVYVGSMFLLLLHQVSQKLLGYNWGSLLDGYLDPLLGAVVLLGLAEVQWGWFWRKLDWQGWTPVEVIAMTLALAVVFEEVFPRIDPARQTRDVWDYLACGAGGVLYWTCVAVRR